MLLGAVVCFDNQPDVLSWTATSGPVRTVSDVDALANYERCIRPTERYLERSASLERFVAPRTIGTSSWAHLPAPTERYLQRFAWMRRIASSWMRSPAGLAVTNSLWATRERRSRRRRRPLRAARRQRNRSPGR